MITEKCKLCEKEYKKTITSEKNANGTKKAFYENGIKVTHVSNCYECYRAKINKTWEKRKLVNKNYEHSFDGYIMRMYRNMKSRVLGIQWKKAHLYKNKELMTKEEFYQIAKTSKDFLKLFNEYKKQNRKQSLAPSVDRINSSIGYTKENIRFITHSENSKLGNASRRATRTV